MRKLLCFVWIWCISIYAVETDFDCVVVGTSPFSLFEAVYQRCLGHRVVVVERASECGGAWKSITVCGIPHVDLGCHEYGNDQRMQKFFEEYLGCQLLTKKPIKGTHSFYPAGGCYEMVHHVELLMERLGIPLLLNTKLESVFIDTARDLAVVKLNEMSYTTKKLIVTSNTELHLENPVAKAAPSAPIQYPHLYLLISDPTPPRFTYANFSGNGASRAMNNTFFRDELQDSDLQLISIQVHGLQNLNIPEKHFAELKKQNLIDSNARLLKSESYIFEQNPLPHAALHKLEPKAQKMIDIINTGHINNVTNNIEKWKKVLKPWNEMMGPAKAA